jgi:hypothetical protein
LEVGGHVHTFVISRPKSLEKSPSDATIMAVVSGEITMRAFARKEVAMFQMLNEESTQLQDRKMMIVRVGALAVALLALGAAVYFFAFLPYGTS